MHIHISITSILRRISYFKEYFALSCWIFVHCEQLMKNACWVYFQEDLGKIVQIFINDNSFVFVSSKSKFSFPKFIYFRSNTDPGAICH